MSTDSKTRTQCAELTNLNAADLDAVLGGAGCCAPGAACCKPAAACCPPNGTGKLAPLAAALAHSAIR